MRRLLTFFALFSTALAEDQITLENKDLFMGKVVALKDGLIEFKSPHSDTPLKILNKDLLQLNFEGTDTGELPKNSQVLSLRNGDHFPGQITSLTDTHLGFDTWFAGTIEVPRTLVNSVHFGMTPQKTISQGPKNISDWTQDNSGGWTLSKGSLVSSKATFIGRNLNLPENFIFGVNIAWKTSPNLRIHICSDQLQPIEKKTGNSYLISVNSSGIDVKRVMPKGSPGPAYRTLITHSTKLASSPSKSVRLELRANRKDRTLQLYLDGNELELGIDPSDPPSGTHILFESLNSTRGNTIIRELIVQEWDTSTPLLRLEPREADDLDTLSVDEGDRYSGKIIGYDPDSPDLLFTVKSPLSPDPIQIPLAHCSVMYFAKGPDEAPAKGQYRLDLRTGGQLTLSNIRLGKETLDASHPWLGDLKVSRRIMSSISKGQ